MTAKKTQNKTGNILVVEVTRLDVALLVVVGAFEDRPAPLAQQALSDALDADLGPLAFGVEEDDLADAAGEQGVLLNGQAGQGHQNIALDIVGRQRAVIKRLQEELDMLQEVGVRVDDGRLIRVAVQEPHHLRQQLELVHRRLALLARDVVGLARFFHAQLQIGYLLV